MKRHLCELTDSGAPWGDCPTVDAAAIRRRVDAALDAAPAERRRYMHQRLRFAAILAAVLAALCVTALAVSRNFNVLQAFFQGDTSQAEHLMDQQPRSISGGGYTLTVTSSVSDGQRVFLILQVTADTAEARENLMGEDFREGRVLTLTPNWDDPADRDSIAVSDGPAILISSFGLLELKEARTEDSRTWKADVDGLSDVPPATVSVKMEGIDGELLIPVMPAEQVNLEISDGAVGLPEGGSITLKQVTFSPFTLSLRCAQAQDVDFFEVALPLSFLMDDGSVVPVDGLADCEQSYAYTQDGQSCRDVLYTFRSIQDLEQITAVLFNGTAYPTDGSAPYPAA